MRCIAPIKVKNPAFDSHKGTSAYSVNDGLGDRVLTVRCGRCEGCLKTRISEWAFRLEQEAKISVYVHFVTITYDPKYVPLTASLLPSLCKKDVQKYLKRLRKLLPDDNIRYFIAGEYGSTTYRPHYHGIFFNVSDRECFNKAWTSKGNTMGNIHIGDSIDNGAVPYTLKYMYKKGMVPLFDGDDRLPEFRMMSNHLGSNYLTENMIKWHLADFKNRQYAQFKNGVKIPLPRYYREKLLDLAQQDDFINDRPIRSRSYFRSEPEEKEDYRSVMSIVENDKTRQRLFEKSKNQINRKKI